MDATSITARSSFREVFDAPLPQRYSSAELERSRGAESLAEDRRELVMAVCAKLRSQAQTLGLAPPIIECFSRTLAGRDAESVLRALNAPQARQGASRAIESVAASIRLQDRVERDPVGGVTHDSFVRLPAAELRQAIGDLHSALEGFSAAVDRKDASECAKAVLLVCESAIALYRQAGRAHALLADVLGRAKAPNDLSAADHTPTVLAVQMLCRMLGSHIESARLALDGVAAVFPSEDLAIPAMRLPYDAGPCDACADAFLRRTRARGADTVAARSIVVEQASSALARGMKAAREAQDGSKQFVADLSDIPLARMFARLVRSGSGASIRSGVAAEKANMKGAAARRGEAAGRWARGLHRDGTAPMMNTAITVDQLKRAFDIFSAQLSSDLDMLPAGASTLKAMIAPVLGATEKLLEQSLYHLRLAQTSGDDDPRLSAVAAVRVIDAHHFLDVASATLGIVRPAVQALALVFDEMAAPLVGQLDEAQQHARDAIPLLETCRALFVLETPRAPPTVDEAAHSQRA
jgi:hypothetical protein